MGEKKRLISLDVLRGIAVLMVIINHCDAVHLPGRPELGGLAGFIEWCFRGIGWSGVSLFFVLSGFLVGGLLLAELDKTGKLRIPRFLLRRGMKLWPSYFILLLVLGVTGATHYIDYTSVWTFVGSIAQHVFFLQNYLGLGGNGPTWSLAVEEHFYTTLPFLLVLLTLKKPAFLRKISLVHVVALVMVTCLTLRVVRLMGEPDVDDFMRSHYRFDALFFGVFLQFLWRTRAEQIRAFVARYGKLILVVSFLCVMPTFRISRDQPFMFTIGFTLLSFGYGGFLMSVVCAKGELWEQYRSLRTIAAIGRWSYNIYLWHYFLPKLVPKYDEMQLWVASLIDNDILCVLVQATLYAALSVFAGFLGTKLIETPFLNLRDRIVAGSYKAV